jgi:DNA-binding CsgD family transcriptional regulator
MTESQHLSNREWEVVELLLKGKSNKLIAVSLGISTRTVEFHLKNIYAKTKVRSRMELVLKLMNTPGGGERRKLRVSTVDNAGKEDENERAIQPGEVWRQSQHSAVQTAGKEFDVRKLILSRQAAAGAIAALLCGFSWVAILLHYGHMNASTMLPWILPMALVMVIIGASTGAMGKRRHNSLAKVIFSSMIGTGTGAFGMIPLMGMVIYPLAKIAERLRILPAGVLPVEVSSVLVIVAMLVCWAIVGTGASLGLMRISLRKGQTVKMFGRATEHEA